MNPTQHPSRQAAWAAAATAAWALLATPAHADQLLFQPARQPTYTAPNRLFQLEIGPQWQVGANAGQDDTVEFSLSDPRGGSAVLRIRRRAVPEGAQAKQMMVRALESRRKELPHLSNVVKGDKILRGLRGSAFTGMFWWQGNAQYKRVVEEVFVVAGHDAFEIHLECFPPLYAAMAREREAMYQSFVPRPSGHTPQAEQDSDDEIHFDQLSF